MNHKETDYVVDFSIDVSAATPQEAVKHAWELLNSPGSFKPVGIATSEDGTQTTVDLQQLANEARLCAQPIGEEETRRKAIVGLAKEEHERDGELEIDHNAQTSEGDDNGCYVQAWLWISFEGTQFDKETLKA